MLEDAESGMFDVIHVKSLSEFSKESLFGKLLMIFLKKCKINFTFCKKRVVVTLSVARLVL